MTRSLGSKQLLKRLEKIFRGREQIQKFVFKWRKSKDIPNFLKAYEAYEKRMAKIPPMHFK